MNDMETPSYPKRTARVGGIALIVFASAGIAWFYFATTAPRLGFDDTDDPSVMLRFIRTYPNVFIYLGLAMITMGLSLIVGALAVAETLGTRVSASAVKSISAFALVAAAFFLLGGAVHINASGPLLHMAGLRSAWGEGAFLAFQVTSQALLTMGLFMLCLWAACLSAVGWRSGTLPIGLCALGILPAFRLIGSVLGPLDLMPDGTWFLSLVSLPGILLWCLILGLVLLRRGLAPPAPLGADPAT